MKKILLQHPQGQQGYNLQHVTQLPARQAGPPATAYYNVPPGAQPIMTIHSPNFAMVSYLLVHIVIS